MAYVILKLLPSTSVFHSDAPMLRHFSTNRLSFEDLNDTTEDFPPRTHRSPTLCTWTRNRILSRWQTHRTHAQLRNHHQSLQWESPRFKRLQSRPHRRHPRHPRHPPTRVTPFPHPSTSKRPLPLPPPPRPPLPYPRKAPHHRRPWGPKLPRGVHHPRPP